MSGQQGRLHAFAVAPKGVFRHILARLCVGLHDLQVTGILPPARVRWKKTMTRPAEEGGGDGRADT
jgi:hypothetical protein